MQTSTSASAPNRVAARQPLTVLAKTLGGIQVTLGLGALVGALFIGFPGNSSLLTLSAVDALVAALIFSGLRWAPIPGAVISGAGLAYILFGNPYPQYHLAHPKDGLYNVIVIVVALSGLVFAAMLAAIAQNYTEPQRRTPRWFGFVATGLAGMALGAILIGAVAAPATTAGSGAPAVASDGALIVHLGLSSFSPTTISVPQGGKIEFTDDSAIEHILTYGAWSNGQTQLATPANAPALNNLRLAGGSVEVGPFTTPGTYRIICIVHPGMSITVTVP